MQHSIKHRASTAHPDEDDLVDTTCTHKNLLTERCEINRIHGDGTFNVPLQRSESSSCRPLLRGFNTSDSSGPFRWGPVYRLTGQLSGGGRKRDFSLPGSWLKISSCGRCISPWQMDRSATGLPACPPESPQRETGRRIGPLPLRAAGVAAGGLECDHLLIRQLPGDPAHHFPFPALPAPSGAC